VIGGYTSGYNWQFAPNWVIGYEGETGYIGVKGSSAYAGSATSIARPALKASTASGCLLRLRLRPLAGLR
jgi:hypothetical protein